MNIIEFLTKHFMALLILIFGLIGNSFGLVLVSRNRKQKNGFILMYKYLFITDLINLVFLVILYLQNGFYVSLEDLNKYTCRLFEYNYYLSSFYFGLLLSCIQIDLNHSYSFQHWMLCII